MKEYQSRKTPRAIIAFLFVLGLVAVLIPIMYPLVTSAIGNPTSVDIGDVAVFEDLWVAGDQLWFMTYDVNYSSVPPEDPEDTWQMAIYDTTGLVPIETQPIHYYQYNIISIYFSPATALVWDDPYYVRIMGQPAYFAPLIEGVNMRTWVLTTGAYKDTDDAASYFLSVAEILQADWGITILGASSSRLNTTGKTYFTRAAPGLDTALPDIFEIVTTTPSALGVNYTGTAAEVERKAREGAVLTGALTSIGAWAGLSEAWVGALLIWFGILIVGSIMYAGTRNPQVPLFFAIPVAIWLGATGLGADTYLAIALAIVGVGVLFGLLWLLPRLG